MSAMPAIMSVSESWRSGKAVVGSASKDSGISMRTRVSPSWRSSLGDVGLVGVASVVAAGLVCARDSECPERRAVERFSHVRFVAAKASPSAVQYHHP